MSKNEKEEDTKIVVGHTGDQESWPAELRAAPIHHLEAGRQLQCSHGRLLHSAPLLRAERPQTSVDSDPRDGEHPLIVDDLGERVPVCSAELGVIEMYLDNMLLELFNRNRPTPKADEA